LNRQISVVSLTQMHKNVIVFAIVLLCKLYFSLLNQVSANNFHESWSISRK